MFWNKSRKNGNNATKTTEITTNIHTLSWNAIIMGPKGYLAPQWGYVHYDATTDVANMQYITQYSDCDVATVVKKDITIVEAMAEIANLQADETTMEWRFCEKTWQGPLYDAVRALQLSFRHRTLAPANIKSHEDYESSVPAAVGVTA